MIVRQLVTTAASTVSLVAGAAAVSLGVGVGVAAAAPFDSCSVPGYAIPAETSDYFYCQNTWEQGWSEPDCTGVDGAVANKALEWECLGRDLARTYAQ